MNFYRIISYVRPPLRGLSTDLFAALAVLPKLVLAAG